MNLKVDGTAVDASPSFGGRTQPVFWRLGESRRHTFEAIYVGIALALDLAVAAIASFAWISLRFPQRDGSVQGIPYSIVAALLVPIWGLLLAGAGAYESKFLTIGSEEFRRVLDAGIRLLAATAFLSFVMRAQVARSFVIITIPVLVVITLFGRYALRKYVHMLRARGRCLRRVLVIGPAEEAIELIHHLRRAVYAGLDVVGACVPEEFETLKVDGQTIPVFGEPALAFNAISRNAVDTLVWAGSRGSHLGHLRRLTCALEGSGVDVLVAPAVIDIAGPRIVVRPVEGLPLLHVEEPQLRGPRRAMKNAVEWLIAAALIFALLPIWLIVGVAIRLTSSGPALFRQERIGKNGRKFTMFKFRTMRNGAEGELPSLLDRNECNGPLFKLREDPRRTLIGRALRRFSIDELPQLWNVLNGTMSLIGPRPPLPREVDRYSEDMHRRFLVKPGITGLWQVRGRAAIPWEESVRLDLYYVENWSLAMDILILWKTIFAVLNRRGAY